MDLAHSFRVGLSTIAHRSISLAPAALSGTRLQDPTLAYAPIAERPDWINR